MAFCFPPAKRIALLCALILATRLNARGASPWRGVLTDAANHPMRAAEIHLIGGHGELVARSEQEESFAFPVLSPNNYQIAVIVDGREIGHGELHAPSPPIRLKLTAKGKLLDLPHP